MKIVVITVENLYSNILFQGLLEKQGHDQQIVGVINIKGIFPHQSFVASIVKILKNYSVIYFALKTIETLLYYFICSLAKFFRKFRIKTKVKIKSLHEISVSKNFPLFNTKDINSSGTIDIIKKLNPDLIVSISASQKLSKKIISIPKLGSINIHSSLLPYYKGIAPYFWALKNKEKETGVTIHYVDEKFDTGPIIFQNKININSCDTVQSVFIKCVLSGKELLRTTLSDIYEGKTERKTQKLNKGSYYSWPSSQDYQDFRRGRGKFWSLNRYLNSFR